LVSFWLFNIAGTNPGYADSTPRHPNPQKDIELIAANNFREHRANNQAPLLQADAQHPEHDVEQENHSHPPETSRNQSSRSINFWPPEQKYCEVCRFLQPFRTRHCIFCERCVSKFDHHCALIGTNSNWFCEY